MGFSAQAQEEAAQAVAQAPVPESVQGEAVKDVPEEDVQAAPAEAPALSAVDLVIKEQLEAIRERNDRIAYELNTKDIRDEYKDPQSFMRMIRRDKPSLYDHVSYEIMPAEGTPPKFHKVKLVDKYGGRAMAMFRMRQDDKDGWKTQNIIVLSADQDPL